MGSGEAKRTTEVRPLPSHSTIKGTSSRSNQHAYPIRFTGNVRCLRQLLLSTTHMMPPLPPLMRSRRTVLRAARPATLGHSAEFGLAPLVASAQHYSYVLVNRGRGHTGGVAGVVTTPHVAQSHFSVNKPRGVGPSIRKAGNRRLQSGLRTVRCCSGRGPFRPARPPVGSARRRTCRAHNSCRRRPNSATRRS